MKASENISDPLTSIIISSYNYAPFLREAIDSALQQTYLNKEVIVVDDGSKDQSPEIIKGYGNKIISILKENGGQASSMNAGFKASKGDIIIFLDSDDLLYKDAVENIVPAFQDPTVSKVHWMLDEINATGKRTNKTLPKYSLADGGFLGDLLLYGPVKCGGPPYSPPTSGNAWSRKYIEQIFPIPEASYKTNTDQYLHFLAPVYGSIRAIRKILGGYRVHGSNYSSHPVREYVSEFSARFEQTCNILDQHLHKKGIKANTAEWSRDTWYHQIKEGIEDIMIMVPGNQGFILIDENAWGIEKELEQRNRFHLVDKDGEYFGPPMDDEQAINEIEHKRAQGAAYVFFTSNAFWWLDHYAGFAGHLQNKYPLVIDNHRLKGFNLKKN